ncbi:glycerate kinase [Shewanella sp.]|uniref:glycerate kinase n=1 Tax=Shewanella sp. TaxID=50422 RepID=UPI00356965ED
MKIVIAPDSFKECMTAPEAADAIARGFKEVFPDAEYHLLPMADGGEGTVDAMVKATNGHTLDLEVTGPLGQPLMASYGVLGDNSNTAVIEMASASGLHLVPADKRNPCLTSTKGTGELIRHALDSGFRTIILGLGGSATNDAGAGMLEALGAKLLDTQGAPLPLDALALKRLHRIDLTGLHPALKETRIEVACDVDNPLLGQRGASQVFGPQKGATPQMVQVLDDALSHFVQVVSNQYPDKAGIESMSGAGAAGGMGYALTALLGARLTPGIQLVSKAVQLASRVEGADLVITAEGCIDNQTLSGKTPMGVLECANYHQVPCIALAGTLGPGADGIKSLGMQAIVPILPSLMSREEALRHGGENLYRTAVYVANLISLGISFQKTGKSL